MIYGFPAFALIVGSIAVYFRVRAGASPALWILPIAVGVLTFLGMRRVFVVKSLPSTVHQYQLVASSAARVTLTSLLDALAKRGYQPDVRTIDESGKIGAPADVSADLIGYQVRVVDRRAETEVGMLAVRLRRAEDGSLLGLIEATDTGPGIYDEMAQFAIVALASSVPDLRYVAFGRSPDQRTPAQLSAELPEQPLGLALL